MKIKSRSVVLLGIFPFCEVTTLGSEEGKNSPILGFFWEGEDWRGGEWHQQERKSVFFVAFFCHGEICCRPLRGITQFRWKPDSVNNLHQAAVEVKMVCMSGERKTGGTKTRK